jgi:transcriptional regulator of heat shock response
MSLKEATLEVIKKLPDDVSAEDIMEKVNFVNQVLEGLTASEAGRSISTEELLERIEKW